MDEQELTLRKVLTAAGNAVQTQMKKQLNIDTNCVVTISDGKVAGGKSAAIGFILFWLDGNIEKTLQFELPSYLLKDNLFALCSSCLETRKIENKPW